MVLADTPTSLPAAAPPEPEAPLGDAEIMAQARALQLAPAGGAGPVRLMASLLRPDLAIPEITRLVAAEPALALRTLKVANSAFYQRCGEVGTVDRAVQVLGAATVKGIAAAACLDRGLTAQPGAAAAELGRLRQHSLAVACAAQAIARAVCPELEAEAFMAGVLHDMGLLAMWALRPRTMAWRSARGEPLDAQADTHARCGQLLMQAWQLPAWLQQAVLLHHRGPLPESKAGVLCAITRLAESMADRLGHGLAIEASPPDSAEAALRDALRRLDTDEAALLPVLEPLAGQIEQFSAALNA